MAEASSTEDVITLRIRFKSDSLEKFAERYAADLTQNEIFIRTRDPLPVGTMLALDLSLHDGSSLITGRGSVAWTRGPELTREAPSGMGIRFEALTGTSRQMLQRILEAKARLANNQPAFPPTLEQTAPSRTTGSSADLPVAVARPDRTAPARPTRPTSTTSTTSGVMSTPARPAPLPASPAAVAVPTAPRPAPVNPLAPTRPSRLAFSDDDAEQTELANVPPAFFYEGADADQEKTRLQDPRTSAALLQQQQLLAQQEQQARHGQARGQQDQTSDQDDPDVDEDDDPYGPGDDDVTNVRSAVSLYGSVGNPSIPEGPDPNRLPNPFAPPRPARNDWIQPPVRPDRSAARPERRTPPSVPSYGPPAGAGDRSGARPRTEPPVPSYGPPAGAGDRSGARPRTEPPVPSYGSPAGAGDRSGARPRTEPPVPSYGPPAGAGDRSGARPRTEPPVPSYGSPAGAGDRSGVRERRTPASVPSFGAPIPAVTREIKAPVPPALTDNLTDHHPLILSTQMSDEPDEPMMSDPASGWPPPLPQTSAIPAPSDYDPESYLGNPPLGNLETMNTSPSLPAITTSEPHVIITPAWPVPAVDPHARLTLTRSIEDEEPASRMSSVKMWVALTLAAGGIVAAALLLLPALLRPAPEAPPTAAAPASPPPPTSDPTTGVATPPPGSAPAAADQENVKQAKETGEQNGNPAAPPPTATPPPAAAKPEPPAPAAIEARDRPAARPVRPGRGNRRSTREVIAAAEQRERVEPLPPASEPAADPPKAALAPSAPMPGEGAEDVYWLTVRSIPSGADVLIDGQVEGQTPFVRRIFDPTRSYTLTVRRPGFEPHDRTLSTSDVWTKRGNVRTLTVVAKLSPTAGLPTQGEPAPPVAPGRGADPTTPTEPSLAPPPVEPDRKTNPFAEPGAPGGAPPQPQ